MSKSVEAIFAVVVADPRWAAAAERHRLDEQINVHQVNPTPAVGQLADEAIDGPLVAAEDKARKWAWCSRDPLERLIEGLVGQDW